MHLRRGDVGEMDLERTLCHASVAVEPPTPHGGRPDVRQRPDGLAVIEA